MIPTITRAEIAGKRIFDKQGNLINLHKPKTLVSESSKLNAPDLSPVTEAIAGLGQAMLEGLGRVTVQPPAVNVSPPLIDLSIVAESIDRLTRAVEASRPATNTEPLSWKFTITRNRTGAIEEVTASRSPIT